MRRGTRWLVGILGAALLAALLLAAASWLLIDRDGLRRLVVGAVRSQTGWDLAVAQPVGLGFDGGIGLTLRGLQLTGPAGGPFRADALELRLKPWPLLMRRVEVDSLRLEGLAVDQGPRRIDASTALRVDAATQALLADPLDITLDGAPLTGHARWQGGVSPALTAELRGAAIVLEGARLANATLRTGLADGVITQTVEAELYGGRGHAVLELRGAAPPVWSLRAKLERLRIHELARDLGRPGRLEGVATLEADLGGQGVTEAEIRRTLAGSLRLALRDGAYVGIDLPHLVDKVGTALDGKPAVDADQRRTPLTALDATATVRDGVLRNDDLRGEAPPFQLSGAGTVDLPAERLDYLLTARLPAETANLGKRLRALRGVPIPVRLSGPIAEPQATLDVEAALRGAARLRLEDKLDGKLGDKLRGLLGR